MQRAVDKELNLYSDLKEQSTVVAQVIMLSLTSQPVDHEDNGTRKHPVSSDVGKLVYHLLIDSFNAMNSTMNQIKRQVKKHFS